MEDASIQGLEDYVKRTKKDSLLQQITTSAT